MATKKTIPSSNEPDTPVKTKKIVQLPPSIEEVKSNTDEVSPASVSKKSKQLKNISKSQSN